MSWFKRSAQKHIPQTADDRMRNELLGGDANAQQDDQSSVYGQRPPSYTTVDDGNDTARNELFSGAPSSARNYGGGINQSAYEGIDEEGEGGGVANEEEEVEAIKQQTRYVKEDSKDSTRNALRIARETEENATTTMMKLGDQSERIADTERHLDLAKAHSNRAEDKAKELKKLNRSIFRPVITWKTDRRRQEIQQKIEDRHETEREEREKAHADVFASRKRVDEAIDPRKGALRGFGALGRKAPQASSSVERSKYQFEATASDDEIEDEIDSNLDEISQAVGNLKRFAIASGEEVETQNTRLDDIHNKAGRLDDKIFRNTEKLKKIK
ncbi:hypothetical protein E3Q23_02886 [Wallemia mellicola]|uniref:t-SNARE coiled-coil homology domain-containing protein n=1 Tax=Wallemia mellicola TaxID=1708541 RepID=A0A4T0TB86_9BASI|nr:hypothetical protein E3Q23_02886 [Wallemia mellicola]TIC62382.1 hypothetical protein E3Q01_03979 [Wallemia mellicola]